MLRADLVAAHGHRGGLRGRARRFGALDVLGAVHPGRPRGQRGARLQPAGRPGVGHGHHGPPLEGLRRRRQVERALQRGVAGGHPPVVEHRVAGAPAGREAGVGGRDHLAAVRGEHVHGGAEARRERDRGRDVAVQDAVGHRLIRLAETALVHHHRRGHGGLVRVDAGGRAHREHPGALAARVVEEVGLHRAERAGSEVLHDQAVAHRDGLGIQHARPDLGPALRGDRRETMAFTGHGAADVHGHARLDQPARPAAHGRSQGVVTEDEEHAHLLGEERIRRTQLPDHPVDGKGQRRVVPDVAGHPFQGGCGVEGRHTCDGTGRAPRRPTQRRKLNPADGLFFWFVFGLLSGPPAGAEWSSCLITTM